MVDLRTIDTIAVQLRKRAPKLPFGIAIRVDDDDRGIVVGNEEYCFAITKQMLEDEDLYLSFFDAQLPELISYLTLPSKAIH